MKIEKLMVKDVFTCAPEDDLRIPARALWEGDCGSLPVVDASGRVIGMITDRDICMAAYTRGLRLQDIRVQDVMSKSLVSCRIGDSVEQAEELMRRQKVRRIPVIDGDKRLLGLLSICDIARAASAEPAPVRDASLGHVGLLLADVCAPRERPEPVFELEPGLRKLSASALEIC